MNIKLVTTTVAGAVSLIAFSPVSAQQKTEAPAAPQAGTAQTKDSKKDEVVCEKTEVVGSRLATKKVCMTRAEWAESRRLDRQEINKAQTAIGMKGN